MHRFLVFGLLLMFVGCELPSAVSVIEDGGIPNKCLGSPDVFESEYQAHAMWVTPEGDVSEVTIDYGNQLDAFHGEQTPIQVAQMAYWTRVAAVEYLLEQSNGIVDEELAKVFERLTERLQHTHYIVAANEENFYWQLDFTKPFEEHVEESPFAAAFVRGQCYELPEGAFVSSIYKSSQFFRLDLITHELMHPIGFWAFGDGDGKEHSNPALWSELDDRSIQSRAMELYTENIE